MQYIKGSNKGTHRKACVKRWWASRGKSPSPIYVGDGGAGMTESLAVHQYDGTFAASY